jgi:L-cysteine:1D-myo-inositol 2-amino-2-deoxy-alpha-D-glucopyranoside ligase
MLKLYNSYSQEKEVFEAIDPSSKTVSLYVCGVTPYDTSHLGHALVAVTFDVLRRYLTHLGYTVRHVQNITDVDDSIIGRAEELKVDYQELGQHWSQVYLDSLASINVLPFSDYVTASSQIDSIIQIISKLVEQGLAYPASDSNVYFKAAAIPNYGQLSHLSPAEMLLKAQEAATDSLADSAGNPAKTSDLDFILWQHSRPGEPHWESPWGEGRPGWHIECSAICMNHLGNRLEIHGGGSDLLFPHHSSEIAQSESYTQQSPFVKYWMHIGMVHINGAKMSKSLKNLVLVRDVLEKYSADTLRIYLLSTHYRIPSHYDERGLVAAQALANLLRETVTDAITPASNADLVESYKSRFYEALDDDLNTPLALTVLREISEEAAHSAAAKAALREMANVLGLTLTR